ncbi:MAG: CheR family methyltransferase, partial [Bacteroidota bacterium]
MPTKKIEKLIGIGASAGGLDAIQVFFDNVPADTGYSFVIIQHLSPNYKSLMPELLARHTDMEIFTAEHGQVLDPNCVYLNQSKNNLQVKGGQLYQVNKDPSKSLNLPIDLFFHSLGQEYGNKAVAIVLSGTGSDGSRGVKTIRENGGLIFVQSPDSAQFDGMPNTSIATGLSDFIMSPKEIGHSISKYSKTKLLAIADENEGIEQTFLKILTEIQKDTGIDFKRYKRNTLMRRMEKRININHLDSLNAYLAKITEEKEERTLLFDDFLIGVTSFFRDKDAYELLEREVFPKLCYQKDEGTTLRIWTPGCSTGEEAYSIAMLLDHYLQTRKLKLDYKIFATDIDKSSLMKASLGTYHANAGNEMDRHFLERYFLKTGDQIQVSKKIRDHIVFSNNDLLKDPPFIRMDFIVCRNVLIYLESDVQEQILGNFMFSLNTDGFLFLGNSESLSKKEQHFHVINGKWRIFQIKTDASNKNYGLSSFAQTKPPLFDTNTYPNRSHRTDTNENSFYKFLSNQYSPSLIFIDENYNICFIKGDAGKKLNPKEGIFHQNLIQMVDPSFAAIIRNGVRRAKENDHPIEAKDVSTNPKNNETVFDITFYRAESNDFSLPMYVIAFGEDRVNEA